MRGAKRVWVSSVIVITALTALGGCGGRDAGIEARSEAPQAPLVFLPGGLYTIAGDEVDVEVEGTIDNFTVVGIAEPSGSRTTVTIANNQAATGVWLDFEAGTIETTATSATWSGQVGGVAIDVRLDKAADGYDELIRVSLSSVVEQIARVPEDFARDVLASPETTVSADLPGIPIGDGSSARAALSGSLAEGIRYRMDLPDGDIWGWDMTTPGRMVSQYAEVKTGSGYASIYLLRQDVVVDSGGLEFGPAVYGAGGNMIVTPVVDQPIEFDLRSDQTGERETVMYEPGAFYASTREFES